MKVTKSVTFTADEVRAALEARYPHLAGKAARLSFLEGRYSTNSGVLASWDENEVEEWAPKPAHKKAGS